MVPLNTQMKRHDVYNQIKCILKIDKKKDVLHLHKMKLKKKLYVLGR